MDGRFLATQCNSIVKLATSASLAIIQSEEFADPALSPQLLKQAGGFALCTALADKRANNGCFLLPARSTENQEVLLQHKPAPLNGFG